MKENKHREPTLFIVGNPERKDEIKHIIEEEWGGINKEGCTYGTHKDAYFVGLFGFASSCSLENIYFKEAVSRGLMKEYKLPEKPQFKPFDKVVVRDCFGLWRVDFFSHIDNNLQNLKFSCVGENYDICLPYNEQTAKLIGTNDEWEGCNND